MFPLPPEHARSLPSVISQIPHGKKNKALVLWLKGTLHYRWNADRGIDCICPLQTGRAGFDSSVAL
jgi:hypothetical protein